MALKLPKGTQFGFAPVLATKIATTGISKAAPALASIAADAVDTDDVVVLELGTLNTLKRFKDEVNEVTAGQECGMQFQGFQDIKEGDYIECFTVEEIKRTLD